MASHSNSPRLVAGLGLWSAVSLNMLDMIGVGPFITVPLIVSAMGGPQAMLGWVLGAFFALCDGLVWAELSAAMPGSGGSYRYLRECYGPQKLGRLVSFLFIWQLSFSAPLSIASGAIGLASYATVFWPGLETPLWSHRWAGNLPWLETSRIAFSLSGATLLAISVVIVVLVLLYRKITSIARISRLLWLTVMATIAWIIFAGLTHFHSTVAFDFPAGAFSLSRGFFLGLGSAMLIATYDYWGYYNVSFLGDEVRTPSKTIPRAVLLSILVVACLYLVMNVSILGVVPWREMAPSHVGAGFNVVSVFMQNIYGAWAGKTVSALIMLAALGSVFSLMLGYSRVPYAAALDGNYFKAMARVHPEGKFPYVSLIALASVAIIACFFSLAEVIAALVVIRILLQFLLQAVGLIILRWRRPELPRPFRMWLYPAPAVLAVAGFLFILFSRKHFVRELRFALVILAAGLIVYSYRAWREREWPFASTKQRQDG
jgi:amino acid transporter